MAKRTKCSKYNPQNKEKGSVLVVTLIIFSAIVVTSLSVTFATLRQLKTSMQASKTNIAYQNADEGIDNAMFAILKGTKKVNPDGNVTVDSIMSLLPKGKCVSSTGKIVLKDDLSERVQSRVDLLDSDENPINCSDTNDISEIVQLKSIGSDEATGTQRVVGANVMQKDRNIKLLLHMDGPDSTFDDPADVIDSSRVHHTVENKRGSGGEKVSYGNRGGIYPNITPNHTIASFYNSYLDIKPEDDQSYDWKDIKTFTVDFWAVLEGSSKQTLFRMDNNSGKRMISLEFDGTDKLTLTLSDDSACPPYTLVNEDEKFYHFAISRDSEGKTRLFVNGIFIDDSSCPNKDETLDIRRITIGRNGTENTQYFQGFMDEFRFYNKAIWTDSFDDKCPINNPSEPEEECPAY